MVKKVNCSALIAVHDLIDCTEFSLINNWLFKAVFLKVSKDH